ncbi:MAG: AMP-binding protein [Pseudomonadota bacterium]|nr:AMP-binding protein [Pseudomonadota bacterium]
MILPTSRIRKGPLTVAPNLVDYDAECARFTWEEARARLDGLPAGGLHIAHEAVDRHAAGPITGKVAIRWRGVDGRRRDVTYAELARTSSRFANALRGLGLQAGDRVFVLLPRVPELFGVVMGALKAHAVVCTLFPAFGPEPLRQRLTLGVGRVLVTTPALYAKKVAAMRGALPALEHVILVGEGGALARGGGADTLDLAALCAAAADTFTIPATDPSTPALLHFTSGTTGRPKGALHVHEAVVHHHASAYYALDLHPDDIFWCTADPGWVTGTSYGIVAPLTHGVTSVVYEGDFDAEAWYRLLREEGVTVWYTAPTAVRMMMKAGLALARQHAFPCLRFVASVGEPLNPEAVRWGVEALGMPIHDNWWQTETGGILIANYAGSDVLPGSMGRPLPGIQAAVVRRVGGTGVGGTGVGGTVERLGPGEQGELAIRAGWPGMFRAYVGDEARYRACFAKDGGAEAQGVDATRADNSFSGGWYLTGDLARVDAEGFFWFVGRADDVIKTSGHLVGPFEVESVLMEHPGVAEAAVIGKPDPIAGEIVKAFVSLKAGQAPSDELRRAILALARTRLGGAIAPREIDLVASLPKTRSGKVMRRLLKARELGLPEGDTSTLESEGVPTTLEPA